MTQREKHLFDLQARYSRAQLQSLAETHGTPLLVVDKQVLANRYQHMKQAMPRVEPHFAVKSHPSLPALEIMRDIGGSLDLATSGEIELARSVGFPATRAIHTHPHKTPQEVEAAIAYGIRTFAFDSPSELDVLEPYKDIVTPMMRLSFPNSHAHIDLSYKFGVNPQDAAGLALHAKERGFNLTALCFHVGSQLSSPQPFVWALNGVRKLVKALKSHAIQITTIDIGGGFPVEYTTAVPPLDDFAETINPLLDMFPDVRFISEPGRYLIGPSVLLLTQIVNRTERHGHDWLFINDGAYGTYSDIFSGKMQFPLFALSELDDPHRQTRTYTVCGPTCDSLDIVAERIQLPELQRGDLLLTPNIGAYSIALATEFNSLAKAQVIAL